VGTVDVSGTTHTAAGIYNGDAWAFTSANYTNASGTVNDAIGMATPLLTLANSTTIQDFEGFADSAALNAAITYPVNATVTLGATSGVNGSKSLIFQGTNALSPWYSVIHLPVTSFSLTNVQSVTVAVKFISGSDENLLIQLLDSYYNVVDQGPTISTHSISNANFMIYTIPITNSSASIANIRFAYAAVDYGLTTCAFDNISVVTPVTYNGTAQAAVINSSVSGTVSNVHYNGSATVPTAVGSYSITADFAPSDSTNYNSLSGALVGSFVINPAMALVRANPQTKNYGDANPALTATVVGTVNGDTLIYTLATDATQYSGVGVSNIFVTPGSNPNYSVLATNSTLTINPAPASVTADAKTKTYGATNPTLTATVVGQVAGGDTIHYTLATDATQFSAVGVSNITVTLGSNPNYSVLATNGTLTITAASPAFSGLSPVTNHYGATNLILTGTVSAAGPLYPASGETVSATIRGFTVNGTVTDATGDFSINYNDPSLATNDVAGSPYAITYNYAGNANLGAAADSSTSLTTTNAPLNITAGNDSKCYGDTKTYGSGSTAFTSTGLMNGETIGTVTLTASDTPSGTGSTDPAGNYDLTPGAATGGTFNPNNYLITYYNGTLTVNPQPATSAITGPGSVEQLSTATYSVTGTAGSTYNWTVPAGATFTGGTGNSINVTFGSTSGNVAVTETSAACCTGTPQSEYVTVITCTSPAIVGGMDGPTNLCVGGPLMLTLTNVMGTAPLFYQWQTNGVSILNATNVGYTNLLLSLSDAAGYTCVVTNSCGAITSAVAAVTVNPPPSAPTMTGAANCGPGAVTLNASGSGGTLTWYADAGLTTPVGTGTSFTTPALSSTTTYYVTETSGAGCVSPASAVTATIDTVTANNVSYNETKGLVFMVAETNLLGHASGSGGVTLTAVQSPSANGVTILVSGGEIYYLANLTNTDSFTYTVASVTGGCTATGTVTINPVYPPGTPAAITLPIVNHTVNIKFFGIPGTNYVVESATNILFTPFWPVSTNTAGSDGSWLFTDPNATNQQQYYRSTWQP
jgi:hypothetical protein